MPYVGKKPADIIATAVDTTTGTFSGDLTVDTSTLYVDSANNRVGVGTVSPASAIHAVGSITVATIESTAANGDIQIKGSGTTGYTALRANAENLVFLTNTAEAMRIDSSGNVGIGTDSPTFATGGGLQVKGSSFTSVRVTSGGNTGIDFAQTTSGISYLYNRDNAGISFGTNNTERVRIDESGNVGIGTTDPADVPLTVFSGGAGTNGQLKLGYDGSNYWQIGRLDPAGTGSGNFQFKPNGGTSVLDVDTSGNFMVGTTDNQLFDNTSGGGLCYRPSLSLDIAREATSSSNSMLSLNNTGVDARFIDFRKDATTVGSIGSVASGTNLYISANSGVGMGIGNDNLYPVNALGASTDGSLDIGDASARFRNLYLSGGAYIGGTGTANKLDDYEEGTFTATITAESGSITSYSVASATYTKIGDTVHLHCRFSVSNKGTGTNFVVSGLPFTSARELLGTFAETNTTGLTGFMFNAGTGGTSFTSRRADGWGNNCLVNGSYTVNVTYRN